MCEKFRINLMSIYFLCAFTLLYKLAFVDFNIIKLVALLSVHVCAVALF
jgi:hypothetical protein